MHAIFLLKKNIRSNIIKTILGYPPIAAPESLKEWKMAITSVGQEYNMNLQKTDKIIRQDQKLSTEAEEHLQILESLKITMTKMGSLDASIAMSIDIQQRIIRSQQKKKKP